ncbi:methionyl-tRNA formyltransferase, mitochondrial-like isoform X1 [Zophobas morio]|uniref:methionyl-tRNA formyltransferase, mitochondrial-like isoform X1 n=1 Tax=Zophobas morio TaxID=2755281 RepID=UPI003082AEDD
MGLCRFLSPSYLTRKSTVQRSCSFQNLKKPPWKVLFFGTDDFSIFSLESLTKQYRKGTLINRLEVVTTVKGKPNSVNVFSKQNNLKLHKWPPNITYGQFDVGLVVSFGHLIPRTVIEKFEFGMLNVHASLLPRWRGAAPIIYAIANGDTQTGITIMKISPEKFDVGEIVHQECVQIHADMKMKQLYTTLGKIGAENLVKTLESLPSSLSQAKPQPSTGVTYAPKISPQLSHIKWEKMTSQEIYNLARALDGIFHVQTTWSGTLVKLINIEKAENDINENENSQPGRVHYDKQNKVLRILCCDNQFITVEKVGVVGKKIMTSVDFNNGYIKKEPPDCRCFK